MYTAYVFMHKGTGTWAIWYGGGGGGEGRQLGRSDMH